MTSTTQNPRLARRPVNNYVAVERENELELNGGGWDFNRASLRAIIAGMAVALGTMLAMTVLGLAIGATTLDALVAFEEDTAFDPETGILVWFAVTNLVALFAGGVVAGRLAGSPNQIDGLIHGLVVWCLITLVSLALFTTTVGRVINGAAAVVGDGLAVLDDGIEVVVPEAIAAAESREVTLDDVRDEARGLAEDTDDPSLQPEALEDQGEEAADIARETSEDIAQQPATAGQEIEAAVDEFLELEGPSEADREDTIAVIAANSELSEEEARTALNTWEDELESVDIDVDETLENVSDDVAETIAQAAGVVFMGMVMGAFAGMAGGFVGAPQYPLMQAFREKDDDEDESR